MRRKGELSAAQVDLNWPHQIMLPYDQVNGQHYRVIAAFCVGLSLCSRGHTIMQRGTWHRVFCFAEKTDAEKFHAEFGGEWFDPTRRAKGRSWMRMRPPKPKRY